MFLSNTLSNKKHLSRQALYPRRERRGFTAWSGKEKFHCNNTSSPALFTSFPSESKVGVSPVTD